MGALNNLAQQVSSAESEHALGELLMNCANNVVRAPGLGIYLFERGREPAVIHYRGVSDRFLDDYEQSGRRCDPLLGLVLARQSPRAAEISRLKTRSEQYRDFSERHTVTQYLLAPIVSDGAVVGTMNFARFDSQPFGAADLQTVTAIALHLSARMAALRVIKAPNTTTSRLSERDLEVAAMAVRGFTVNEMGRALGVSPNTVKKHLKNIYRRLDVSTRAELALLLGEHPATRSEPPASRRTPSGVRMFATR